MRNKSPMSRTPVTLFAMKRGRKISRRPVGVIALDGLTATIRWLRTGTVMSGFAGAPVASIKDT